MMEINKRLLPIFLNLSLLLLCVSAHAQTACPPGMEEYGAGVCGYSQEEQPAQQAPQRQPPPRWETRWGAIATDGPGGSFGASTNMANRDLAERAAVAECESKKGSKCKVELAYDNECAAMVVGKNGHNSGADSTIDKAVQLGIDTCRKSGDSECQVYYSACSPPVQIQ